MNRFSNFMASCKAKTTAYWRSRSAARRVLEHLGWNLAKVWQEEYFRHPEDVTRTIVELLKKEHLYSQK